MLFAAQHRLHLTAFGVGMQRHFGEFRAMMILSPCPSRRQVSHTVGQQTSLEELPFTRKTEVKQIA
jgi:hypothetical protein